jgi:molybdopterin-guanine dinucleotide biosynthesis protein A
MMLHVTESHIQRVLDIEGFVLAGGASSRMGRDKGLLDFGGVPLLVRTARLAAPLVKRVSTVGPAELSSRFDLEVIQDEDFGLQTPQGVSKGPLIGIATALCSSQSIWTLILACDLPYLTGEWIAWLLARAAESNAEAIVPHTVRGLEPLAAVYRQECKAPIVQSVHKGVRKVTEALKQLRVETVAEHEWREIDPQGRVLMNMNTPADYDEARKWRQAEELRSRSETNSFPAH